MSYNDDDSLDDTESIDLDDEDYSDEYDSIDDSSSISSDDDLLNKIYGDEIEDEEIEGDDGDDGGGEREENGEEREEREDKEEREEKKNKRENFLSGLAKISIYEYPRILTILATNIAESKLLVPVKYEKLFNCESGNAILIAETWIKYRHICPIPITITRTCDGYKSEKIDPNELILMSELGFKDLEE